MPPPSLLELGGYAAAFLLGVRLFEPSERLLRVLLQDPRDEQSARRRLDDAEEAWASKLRGAREGLPSRSARRHRKKTSAAPPPPTQGPFERPQPTAPAPDSPPGVNAEESPALPSQDLRTRQALHHRSPHPTQTLPFEYASRALSSNDRLSRSWEPDGEPPSDLDT